MPTGWPTCRGRTGTVCARFSPWTRPRGSCKLVRLRDDHVAARVAATNQLAALFDQHCPGAAAIFARLDSEIALSFLERYPTA
jgi:hypothetical protein